jgi:hypothetical protein
MINNIKQTVNGAGGTKDKNLRIARKKQENIKM